MKVREIFASIQGEGNYIGLPCIFVRTQGCNLHCEFCDTKETWGTHPEHSKDMSAADILAEVASLGVDTKLIIFTGGEPCIQKDLSDTIDQFLVRDFVVAIETNGTQETPNGVWVTCSPKPDAEFRINPACRPNELKYVITDYFDEAVISEGIREAYAGRIWLQPDGYHMQEAWKKCYDIAMRDPRLRVGVQLHKLMEVK